MNSYDIAVYVIVLVSVPFLLYLSVIGCKAGVARLRVKEVVYKADARARDDESNTTCLICLDEYVDEDVINELECEHRFHKSCLTSMKDHAMVFSASLFRLSCPICRGSIRMAHSI